MTDASQAEHWTSLYGGTDPEHVSWFEQTPTRSMDLIAATGLPRKAAIVDVGGGTSSLAARLAQEGYTDLTVLDISPIALDHARADAGRSANAIAWVQADVLSHEFGRRFDVWHDRAVFHFMVNAPDRDAYLATLRRALAPGGHLVILTFGPAGPTQCSGLPVQRYDIDTLQVALGQEFRVLSSGLEAHKTPAGNRQQFLYAHLKRVRDSSDRGG